MNTVLNVLKHTWDRCAQSHEHDSGDSVAKADGAAEARRQVSDDGREEANYNDGHHETGPAVPVLRGRNEREQNLPEHCQEVHDVIAAGRETLLSTLIFIIVSITWGWHTLKI